MALKRVINTLGIAQQYPLSDGTTLRLWKNSDILIDSSLITVEIRRAKKRRELKILDVPPKETSAPNDYTLPVGDSFPSGEQTVLPDVESELPQISEVPKVVSRLKKKKMEVL